ncbi:3-phosphoserine/phosphohydroxythreonine transaminase [Desulfosporosinus fructosivorans]|uniref:Phosphoserine aminotransferase n=1 Tax=Desulfosporosinus fructosivorans TaxID=2018669 RepID=A0A4Z0R852_9FIRM|nr:3-phosphoserine/phosphohydroxythreonine transaminase [Desulfosporosinus fructosivorans]TGE38595.1 3-phosphoserine/phosphohydroxythreonine transaminase [Desulfosporosinus fructosivorans]
MERIFNFNAGPATMPLVVLEEAQSELLNFRGTGMSVMENSHRTKEYEAINSEAEALVKELLGVPENYRVLFLQGGASTQFAAVPMNLVSADSHADYILTGAWAEKAQKEASKFIKTNIAASTKEENYTRIPRTDEIKVSKGPAYVHLCSNNTIFGTQWQSFPDLGDVSLVGDMSSDIMSRRFDVSKFGLIYAGAQKNLGPAGVTVVIIRKDLLEGIPTNIPSMLRYDIHAKNDSLYNTPPSFSVYMVNLVLRWLKNNGGLVAAEKRNAEKAVLIYNTIDNSQGYYRGHALKDSRSLMNITFRLPSEDLEKKFAVEATQQGMIGLKGHRSVGGLRASIYNAMSLEGALALVDFMKVFQSKNG